MTIRPGTKAAALRAQHGTRFWFKGRPRTAGRRAAQLYNQLKFMMHEENCSRTKATKIMHARGGPRSHYTLAQVADFQRHVDVDLEYDAWCERQALEAYEREEAPAQVEGAAANEREKT